MNTNTKRNSRKKSTNPLDSHIEQYVSELRASGRPLGAEAFSEAVRTFSQRFVEAMLQGEMDAHLTGCQPTETPPEEVDADELSLVPNKRNGFSHKTLKTEFGPLPLSVPRDRRNTFDPIIVPKHSRSFGKMDEQIIAMYARGMSTRDIQAFIDNLYGVDISPDYVSKVTDRVLEDVQEWQNRPLESVYPVAFFDAIRVKIRSGAAVKNMAVHLGIGVRTDGTREVLGMWIAALLPIHSDFVQGFFFGADCVITVVFFAFLAADARLDTAEKKWRVSEYMNSATGQVYRLTLPPEVPRTIPAFASQIRGQF